MDAPGQIPPPRVFTGARLATLAPRQPGLGLVERGAVAVREGRIAYAGPEADVPAEFKAVAKFVSNSQ